MTDEKLVQSPEDMHEDIYEEMYEGMLVVGHPLKPSNT